MVPSAYAVSFPRECLPRAAPALESAYRYPRASRLDAPRERVFLGVVEDIPRVVANSARRVTKTAGHVLRPVAFCRREHDAPCRFARLGVRERGAARGEARFVFKKRRAPADVVAGDA